MSIADRNSRSRWSSLTVLFLLSILGIVATVADPSRGTKRFVVDAGTLGASKFVFARLLEGAASMLRDPCQR
jgi:hypothetical protein